MPNKGRKDRRKSQSIARRQNQSPGNFMVVNQSVITWPSGPTPSYEQFAGYEAVLPGAADRILAMAEQQTKHRLELENRVINHDILKSYLGLGFGLVVCLAGFYTAYKIVELGYPIAGSLFGFAPLAGLVGVFLKATSLRQRERDLMRRQQNQRQ